MVRKKSSESIIRDIKRQTKRKFSSEEKISIVIEGLRGEGIIARISFAINNPGIMVVIS